ncbi:MAG: PilZ domain-containing protein [Pirellulaceae bacterium]
MSENVTAEFQDVIQALLNEDQLFSLRERRDKNRRSFVRPVRLVLEDQPTELKEGFTRDLSDGGIGLLHKFPIAAGTIAQVKVNRLWDQAVVLKCEARWSCKSENGWFQSGWSILAVQSPATS